MLLGRTEAEKLPKLKKCVEQWHQYFKLNNQRFWDYTRFVCASSLSQKERAALQAVGKPQLQFNILESQVSRLLGEFAKHSPSFEVRAMDGVPLNILTPEFNGTMDAIEGYLLHMFGDNATDSLKYKLYKDLLIGGFSVAEVITSYVNARSFEQIIEVQRVFDPTLTIFDPMARLSHKGDGEYAGVLIPMTYQAFQNEFGNKAIDAVQAGTSKSLEGFEWSYLNQQQETVLVASLFVKKYKKMKIVKLSNGHTVPLLHYEKLIQAWEEEGVIELPPKILEQRETEIETLERYKFCGDKILDKEDTDFTMFPLVFIDGNSVLIRGQDTISGSGSSAELGSDSDGGSTSQMCKPYVLHARDMQQMMNFAGQSMANEMENIVQHQYIVPVESIPEDQQAAYTNPQIASCLQYNYIFDKEAQITLPPPQILQRREIPPILENTFNNAARQIQLILGNYDALLGTNDKQVSGVAIQQGALQSNAAALPYYVGFNNGLNRLAEIIVDLIPKYYRTPRTLPIVRPDGKRDYQIINQPNVQGNVFMDYDPNNLLINVEMGVSSAVQKQISLEIINQAMASNPDFASFFGEMGLEVYLGNMDIHGIDHLKELAAQYVQMKQDQKQAASQQPTPEQILAEAEKESRAAEVEQRREAAQGVQANKAAELAIEKQKVDLQFIELMAKIESDEVKAAIAKEKVDAENARGATELAIDLINNFN
ncbi:MAG: portal protein [Caudoviricetes sp.]|nr:MAG: portal protein [Caudoviricetes sp.]